MKKNLPEKADFLNEKRFLKSLKKKKKKNKRNERPHLTKYQLKSISLKHYSEFNRFAIKKFEDDGIATRKLLAPRSFSFGSDFDKTITFFKNLNQALYKSNGRIVIDFKNCKKIHIGAATFLQISLLEFLHFSDRLNKTQFAIINNDIKILNSKVLRVNKMLFSLNLISGFEGIDETGNASYHQLSLITGSKKRSNYRENSKGKIGQKVIRFINETLRVFDLELDEEGANSMLNLMGEILGNAEDHSELNRYYVNGVSFLEFEDKPIVELNLAIINLGYSFYEGFEAVKHKNEIINDLMERLYNHHKSLKGYNSQIYSKESLFTLYGLQEGISRLKFDDESRGNGTMKFIRAFMNLGQFGEENKKYQSKLNIISGHTVIECTNEFKPYQEGTFHRLSLNQEKDIKQLPSKKAIFTEKECFPGTILQVRIFLNKEYFMKVIEND